MQTQRPLAVVSTSVSADVLAVLARVEAAFTPPEIHRLIGAHSPEGVRRALVGLVEQGIVRAERVGRARRYELNRGHLAAPHIVALSKLREELLDRLARRIAGWKVPCTYAALFGSAARNDMRPDSDLDIFVVRPAQIAPDDRRWARQVHGLEEKATSWTGNDVRVLEYDEEGVRAGLLAGERVLADIRDEGVHLAGPLGYLRPPEVTAHAHQRSL